MSASEADVAGYFDTLSNWGRWGAEDTLGTLNLVGPEQRRAALAEAREGRTVSCGHEITAGPMADNPGRNLRLMVESGEGAPSTGWGSTGEWLGLRIHGRTSTHLDALGHLFWNGKGYNGMLASSVTVESGATRGSITSLPGGHFLAHGLLLDLPRSQGVDYLPPGPPGASRQELLDCERLQGTAMQPGDAVLVRTGRTRAEELDGGPVPGGPLSGLAPDCLPLLRERDVAVLGSDAVNDPRPDPDPGSGVHMPIHAVGIVAMGLWLLDNVNLEELAETCAALGRWRFCLVVTALKVQGATGSLVNPMAIL